MTLTMAHPDLGIVKISVQHDDGICQNIDSIFVVNFHYRTSTSGFEIE